MYYGTPARLPFLPIDNLLGCARVLVFAVCNDPAHIKFVSGFLLRVPR